MGNFDYNQLLDKYPLYHPEKKIEYLKSSTYKNNTKETIIKLFNKVYPFEVRYKTDISNFSKEQFLPLLETFTSNETINTNSSYLKHYIEFVNPSNSISIIDIARDNGMLDITHDTKISANSFYSRWYFYEYISQKLFNYRDRLVVALIYEGLTIEEIANIKIDDYKDNLIYVGDKYILTVDKMLSEIIEGAFAEQKYILRNGNIESMKSPYRYYQITKGYLVKYTNQERNRSYTNIDQIFKRCKEYLNRKKMTETNLRKSALLNYVNTYLEHEGNEDKSYEMAFSRFRIDISDPIEKSSMLVEYKRAMESFRKIHGLDYTETKNQSLLELIILFSNDTDSQNQAAIIEDDGPEAHASEKIEIGLKGENIVFEILKQKYPDYIIKKVNEKNDLDGYDLSMAKNGKVFEQIEVKTTNKKRFFISLHELETAMSNSKTYCIYILKYFRKEDLYLADLDLIKTKIELLRVSNPINYLNIGMDFIRRELNIAETCIVRCKSFEIEITKEKFDKIQRVEL